MPSARICSSIVVSPRIAAGRARPTLAKSLMSVEKEYLECVRCSILKEIDFESSDRDLLLYEVCDELILIEKPVLLDVRLLSIHFTIQKVTDGLEKVLILLFAALPFIRSEDLV